MKDWQRSPEPPSMMGVRSSGGSPSASLSALEYREESPDFQILDGAWPPRDDAGPSRRQGTPPSLARSQRKVDVSLAQMAIRTILRHITAVNDLGDMPFSLAKPILEQCRPAQLAELEDKSPHLKEETDDIWKRNCLRDFLKIRRDEEAGTLKQPSSWRKLYLRTLGKEEEAKEAAAERIKARYASHRAEKESKKVVVSDRPIQVSPARRPPSSLPLSSMTKGQSMLSRARSAATAQARYTNPRPAAARPLPRGPGRDPVVAAAFPLGRRMAGSAALPPSPAALGRRPPY